MKDEIQNNKLLILGKLAASLAHEIRNPLSAIKLNLDYLNLSKDDFSEDSQDCIANTIEAANRIQNLIENTLEFTKKSSSDTEVCSINEICKQAIVILHSAAIRKNIKIVTDFDNQIPDCYLNSNKILQVILNLLNNAIDASFRKSEIHQSTKLTNSTIILEVKDFGEGINDDDKEKVLKDFYTSKVNGIGLGLSVCKRLCEEAGAELNFTSEVGIGSTFYIKFPLSICEEK